MVFLVRYEMLMLKSLKSFVINFVSLSMYVRKEGSFYSLNF
jgi:hypothetical protein